MQKTTLAQDLILNQLRTSKIKCDVILTNGFRFQDTQVMQFDAYAIVINDKDKSHMIYKHAISTISPKGKLVFNENAKPEK